MASLTRQPRPSWLKPGDVFYPETDGQPIAEGTKQFDWIVYFFENVQWLFREEPNVFVAGDLFWYPIEGRADIVYAPDCMVAFGRPAGDRRSYKQWEEGGIAPQVTFEVMAPSSTTEKMASLKEAYERYGVQEFYLYDPGSFDFRAWHRRDGGLEPVQAVEGLLSPRLNVRFWPSQSDLKVERPDGYLFETFSEVADRIKSGLPPKRLEWAWREGEFRSAEQERQQAERERQRADRLAAKLRAAGVDPDEI